jgi:uncharacterized protein with HEPN domain
MRLETNKHLYDILDAIDEIQAYVRGESLISFLAQSMIQSAVMLKFLIAGEALNRLQRSDTETFSQITEARSMMDFRNIILHDYDTVEPTILWDAINARLPTMKTEVEKLISASR